MLVELVGMLVYINTDKWDQIIQETDFLEFVQLILTSQCEDDLILETIMLVSTLAKNEKCCEAIAGTQLIGTLHDMLGAKQEDDEMV